MENEVRVNVDVHLRLKASFKLHIDGIMQVQCNTNPNINR